MSMVRRKLLDHVKTPCREWCVTHATMLAEYDKELHSIGIHNGLTVLQNITEHDSDRSYTRRVAVDKAKGLDVGTKQHSRHFVKPMRHSLHRVIIAGINKLLTENNRATLRPPAFAFILDKATILKRTGQMHGIITMVEGELKALFLGVELAKDGSGKGLGGLLRVFNRASLCQCACACACAAHMDLSAKLNPTSNST